MTLEISIPADHPSLPGHFPGRPVVPAVVLIDRISNALGERVGRPILHMRQMRLLGPVSPGRRLQVEFEQKKPDEWRVVCTSDGAVVCKGTFVASPSGTVPAWPALAGDAALLDAWPLYELLPHSGTMRLVRALRCTHEGLVSTETQVEAGHPLAEDGQISAWSGLEYAAQLMALQSVMAASENDPPAQKRALIVIVRALERAGRQIAPGSKLAISARRLMVQGEAAQCDFVMTADGKLAVSGEFTVLASRNS